MKQVDKDIEKSIVPEVEPLLTEDKLHNEVCQEYIQKQFVSPLCYFIISLYKPIRV